MADANAVPMEERLEDRPAHVAVEPAEPLGDGFRPYERYHLVLTHRDGTSDAQERDILRGGEVVGVIAFDPAREALVLLRQFRLPAHLATGKGEMVEIVAGGVEAGESLKAAAARECEEETGLKPRALVQLMRFLPTPGITDEHAALFLGVVDSARLPERAGEASEVEVTHPFAIGLDAALDALADGRFANGYLIIALQWVALNRHRLHALAAEAEAVAG